MREPYERITGGPFRDDTHRAAVEATAVDLAGRQSRGNSPHVPGSPEKAADGVSGGLAMQIHAGASEAAQRAPHRLIVLTPPGLPPCLEPSIDVDPMMWDLDHGFSHASYALAAIYDAATRALASAGPLPLASTEPWVESDEAYRERLGDAYEAAASFGVMRLAAQCGAEPALLLDHCGSSCGLPRARLVLATTKESM